jgi:hypothetical protein
MCPSDGSLVVGPIDPATNRGRCFVEKLSGDFPGDVDRGEIYLRDAVRQTEFGQNDARTPKVSVSTTSQPTPKKSA